MRQEWARAKRLVRHMRLRDAVRVLALEWIGRRWRVRVRIGNVALTIRTRTSDAAVAFASLVDGDYDGIRLQSAAVIIDAGANIGTSAIALARKYPEATIIAIEPEAENFSLLEENVRPWSNIKAWKGAITAESGEMPLLDRGTGPWGYTVTHSHQTVGGLGQTVRCRTVKQVLDQFGFTTVDILKLDIEGGEKEILENADEWIECVGVLVAELHDRIVPGCEAAFDNATRTFQRHATSGEKYIAYRNACC